MSLAITTGAGSEVLYRTTINTQAQTVTAFRWDKTNATTGTSSGTGYVVPADHIITVLSIVINNNSTTATFKILRKDVEILLTTVA